MQYGEEYGLRLYDEGEFAVAELIIPRRKWNMWKLIIADDERVIREQSII